MNCDECAALLGAYSDGELDVRSALAVETHLASCASCRQRLASDRALHDAFGASAEALRYRPTPEQTGRIRAALGTGSLRPKQPGLRFVPRPGPFLRMAAVLALVLLGFGLGRFWPRGPESALRTDELVASHVRARLAGRPTDVLSSDRHTVKPWFNGKLDYAPVVIDLAANGFPLAGGRLDYIAGRPTAVLIYRAGQHSIDVFTWPTVPGSPADVPLRTSTVRGYHLVEWSRGGMVFWAVSDAAPDRLSDFARMLAAAAPR